MLRTEALTVPVLEPASFGVAGGEIVAVTGPSGSGKTLLLRALADLDPAPGRVFLEERERASFSGPEWRRHVRYVAAEPAWWAATARMHFPSGASPEEAAAGLGLARAILDRPIAELSTGERQRMALVRALADDPEVLLLDEPTGSLDAAATALVEELIAARRRAGAAILMVSHASDQVTRLADRRFVIADGRVAEV